MSGFRRFLLTVCLASGAFLTPQPASACPMCKVANEEVESKVGVGAQTVNEKPRAYMYSILFMIAMPATIFTGFGTAFYLMVRRARHAENPATNSVIDSL